MREQFEMELLPQALLIGLDEETFWKSNPRKMKAYIKAYELKEEEVDRRNWTLGQYFMTALNVVLDHSFNKNATSKYPQKPFLADEYEEVDIELQKEINANNIFSFLEESKKAFEENHKGKGNK